MAAKVMALRRDDVCAACSIVLPAGTKAQWDSTAKSVTCLACVEPSAEVLAAEAVVPPNDHAPIDIGDPGRSAREEYERRRARREAQVEQKWGTGRLGKMAKFLSDDPQTTKAWSEGASGEERVAQVLHERLGEQAVLLHDRKVPGTRGNIDHLVIAASGAWIVDAKKYKGKVERRDVGGWFKTDLRLYVGGRDRTKTVKGLGWQVEAVRSAMGEEMVPVHSAVSFVGAEWPIFFAKPFKLHDAWISWPTKLAELIAGEGPLLDADIERVARLLADRLPSK